MSPQFNIVCAAKLHANQLERHLELFEHIPEISRVCVVRNAPIAERLSKVRNFNFARGNLAGEAYRMVRQVERRVHSEQARWVVAFNPVPWGTLASFAARRQGVRVCLSLIGMDYLQIQKWWGLPFLRAVRDADALTVTGKKMVEGLVRRGVNPKKIRILPHSVDIERFRPAPHPEYQFDLLAVGQLIARKRMDILLDALALLRDEGQVLRLGILGKGPLEAELRAQVSSLRLHAQVEFLGYRDDVESVLSRSKVFILASEWEGVPFAMMEAMASGMVPVVTDVGTISDWVRDDDNGRVVPPRQVEAMRSAIAELFANHEAQLKLLRAKILAERERLGFAQGAKIWRDIFALDEEVV